MKRIFFPTLFLGVCAVGTFGQTPTTPPATTAGQVCRITQFRTKPGKGPDLTRFRRQNTKVILDEQRKQGLIQSYAFYTKPVNEGPHDWDLAQMVCFRNYADAIDANPERAAKFDAIGLKHYGSDEARTKANLSLNDLRDVVSSILVREQILNPLN